MKKSTSLTVKEMALISGVTVRTLHHYDEIGLLIANRSGSGYRIYSEKHALRLQQILLHKAFGLSLNEIAKILDDPHFDTLNSLQQQKRAVVKQLGTMQSMIQAIDAAISRLSCPSNTELTSIFNGFDPKLYEEEVAERWGDTEAYKQSQNRTKHYTTENWQQIKQEETHIWQDAAVAMQQGRNTTHKLTFSIVDRYRRHIDKWFYTTSTSSFIALADMWQSDPRFTKNIDKYGAGLSTWFTEAVRKYAEQAQ